jgi:hypothetical protein
MEVSATEPLFSASGATILSMATGRGHYIRDAILNVEAHVDLHFTKMTQTLSCFHQMIARCCTPMIHWPCKSLYLLGDIPNKPNAIHPTKPACCNTARLPQPCHFLHCLARPGWHTHPVQWHGYAQNILAEYLHRLLSEEEVCVSADASQRWSCWVDRQ